MILYKLVTKVTIPLKGQAMQDAFSIGSAAGSIISGMLFNEHLTMPKALSIDITTLTGSVYVVELWSGDSWLFSSEDNSYVMRRGHVKIDGTLHDDVLLGFSVDTGTILLMDDEHQLICQPSLVAGIQLF